MKKWVSHPCIIEDDNHQLSLRIFHYFYCEMNLPKYQKNFKFTSKTNSEEITFQLQDWESLQDTIARSASSTENDRNNSDYIRGIKNMMNKKLPFFKGYITGGIKLMKLKKPLIILKMLKVL